MSIDDGPHVSTSPAGRRACGALEGVEPHVLVVIGELDAATAPWLAERLAVDATIRVIDLRRVTFVDAYGIRPLVGAAARNRPGQTIELRAPSRAVRRFLTLVGLELCRGRLRNHLSGWIPGSAPTGS